MSDEDTRLRIRRRDARHLREFQDQQFERWVAVEKEAFAAANASRMWLADVRDAMRDARLRVVAARRNERALCHLLGESQHIKGIRRVYRQPSSGDVLRALVSVEWSEPDCDGRHWFWECASARGMARTLARGKSSAHRAAVRIGWQPDGDWS